MQNMLIFVRLLVALSLASMLSACVVGEDYQMPDLSLSKDWSALKDEKKEAEPIKVGVRKETPCQNYEITGVNNTHIHISEALAGKGSGIVTPAAYAPVNPCRAWWERFGDPTLSTLVKKAIAQNNDLKVAQARLAEARAAERVATSALFPQVNATASLTRQKTGGATGTTLDTLKDGGLSALWNLDLFGGTQRSIEAAGAEIQATEADRDRVMLALVSETARTYIQLRALQQQYVLTEANLEAQKQTLEVTLGQHREGAISDLEVARARAQTESTEAALPQIKAAEAAAMNRLNVLIGNMTDAIKASLTAVRPIPVIPQKLVVAMPVASIANRPDVHAAERRLGEATALSGVAISQMYPQVSLQGLISRQSSILYGMATPWTAAGSTLLPLIDFGRIRGQIDAADARQQQAFFGYQQTILLAVEETENALSAYLNEQRRGKRLASAALEQDKAADIAREQYKAGVTTQLDLLVAENNRLSAETQFVVSQAAVATHLVELHTALGDRWQPESNPWETCTVSNGNALLEKSKSQSATKPQLIAAIDKCDKAKG